MKTYNLFLVFAVLSATFFCSCNNDSDNVESIKSIKIDTNVNLSSRVTTNENATYFDNEDEISVYAWTGDANNIDNNNLVIDNVVNSLSINGNTHSWNAKTQMLWKDMETKHFFLGIYPPRKVENFSKDSFVLDSNNQTSNDILVAINNTGISATNNAIPLIFDHIMSKIIVNLKFLDQWETAPQVKNISIKGLSKASINYITKDAIMSGNQTQINLSEISKNSSYQSIMVPQTGVKEISINIEGKSEPYTFINDKDLSLIKGKYTTINLEISRNKISLGDITVNDWKQGEDINSSITIN